MANGARRHSPRARAGTAGAWWRGFGVGLGSGVLACVALYFTQGGGVWGPERVPDPTVGVSGANVPPAGPGPEFSFFTVLPEEEVPVPDEALAGTQPPASQGIRVLTGQVAPVQPVPPESPAQPPPASAVPPAATAPPVAPPPLAQRTPDAAPVVPPPQPPALQPRSGYLLQAGSFRNAPDAERLKAQLALRGLRADVQQVSVNGGTFHRVRVGPYASLDELAGPRETLRAAGVPTLVVKLRAE